MDGASHGDHTHSVQVGWLGYNSATWDAGFTVPQRASETWFASLALNRLEFRD